MKDKTANATLLHKRRSLQMALASAGALLLVPRQVLAQESPAAAAAPAKGQILRVGPLRELRTLAAASKAAKDGDVLEVDAGDYPGDVAAWPQNHLRLQAVGGRVRLLAQGAAAQGKGIFVTTGRGISIEGFDFIGAQVPDQNGAGIRLEAGSLSLRDCTFKDNENGVLTSNDEKVRLEIEDCEFGTIVRRKGQNHNLYVGAIAYLRVVGSYFHHGQSGHLLKSRAAVNHIFYNRLTDELGGHASYELEFPNGGLALVVGNVIQQSAGTENPHLIAFGAEGYGPGRHELHLINNTVVDQRPSGGVYLRVNPSSAANPAKVRLINNLWVGNSQIPANPEWEQAGNFLVDLDTFVLPTRDNYLLKPGAKIRGRAVDPGEVDGLKLRPTEQFLHPRGTLKLKAVATNPGAFQFP